MKFNDDMLDVMRKATSLLQSGKQRDANNAITRLLQRVLPGALPQPPAQPAMKDINPPPADRASHGGAAPDATPPPAAVVPDFVANMLETFGIRNPLEDAVRHDDVLPIAPGQFLSDSLTNAAGARKYKLYVPAA
jgi:hypothetical protein